MEDSNHLASQVPAVNSVKNETPVSGTSSAGNLATDTSPVSTKVSVTGPSSVSQSSSSHVRELQDEVSEVEGHLKLLMRGHEVEANIADTAPIFTENVREHASHNLMAQYSPFNQYGLLGANISVSQHLNNKDAVKDTRVFYNMTAPTSMFICGSQGSGKSHTLSTVLENCLLPSSANRLSRPLVGLVFHYDTFVSDRAGLPCEAAYISSHEGVKVRVLCAPTNAASLKRTYQCLPNVSVEELRIDQTDLNTKRMLDMMAVSSVQGSGMPLYLHVVSRILRDLRIIQQRNNTAFSYQEFKRALDNAELTQQQSIPLQQRLDTLESFMAQEETTMNRSFSSSKEAKGKQKENSIKVPCQDTKWDLTPGQLTIVDLSCPCVTADMACSLFTICLSLFLEQEPTVGRIVALDEAHKYMGDGLESQALTESLLSTIRLQRHLGTRVVISTQEPTISLKILDLCSMTIVHRFSSPDWLKVLQRHLAGVSATAPKQGTGEVNNSTESHDAALYPLQTLEQLFSQIVALGTGEAFVFAPTALVGVNAASPSTVTGSGKKNFVQLGNGMMKLRIRKRVTADGGRSIVAD